MTPLRTVFCAALLGLAGSSAFADGRVTLNFDPDWRFLKADPGAAAASPSFDDSGWARVSAPHTYNDVDTFDHWQNPGMAGEQGQWGGRTWYRKVFTLPAEDRGKKVYIEFEGVRQVGEVYLNGRHLGACKNGFVPFGFDLTPYLKEENNVLAVMCDNRYMVDPAGQDNLGKISALVNAAMPDDVDKIQANQIPWNNARWHPPDGGIYRNVWLHITDPLHISLPLYDFLRTEGPYIYATDTSDGSARLHCEVPIENGRAEGADAQLEVALLDKYGHPVLKLQGADTVAAGGSDRMALEGRLDHPLLWEPAYPYLYTVVLTLKSGGQVIDSTEIPFGFRTVHFTTTAGFFINGHHVKLHGWGQRPTDEWPGLGTAQPDWLHMYTLSLMKAAGSNFMRWGHSAGAPAMITGGDRLGFITDQPGVDGESDTVGAAWKIRAAAFRDVLIYYRNHPSILIWEAGNQKVTLAHAKEMRGLFEQYDPHGGRSLAYRRADQTDAKYMDVGIGTEGGREISNLPVVEGEYDREESPRRIWDKYSPPFFGYPGASKLTYTPFDSEDFAVHEVGQYVRKVGAPWHCGGANWIFSDSTSGGRVDIETARDSGEVDGVRLPKQAYYVCQAMFSSEPQVHIIGHWTYPAGTKKTMYVASNGDDVELSVNGKSLGHAKPTDRFLFTFPNVAWQPGEITAVASFKGRRWAQTMLRTAGPAVALRIRPLLGPGGPRANGSDVVLYDVEALDSKGERCPTFYKRVDFDFSGPGTWRGGWNSNVPGSINQTHLNLECGITRVAVRTGFSAGDLVLTARCEGLTSATATVRTNAFPIQNGYSEEMPATPIFTLAAVRPVFAVEKIPTAAAGPAAGAGRAIHTYSYSGTVSIAHVEADAQDGKNIYVDRDYSFADLPAALKGADWVQAGDADALFSALDFIVIGVSSGTNVYVAHDDRLPAPSWLGQQFKPSDMKIVVHGHPMTVYRRHSSQDETLTFGSNTEDESVRSAEMYVVFAQPAKHRKPKAQ